MGGAIIGYIHIFAIHLASLASFDVLFSLYALTMHVCKMQQFRFL